MNQLTPNIAGMSKSKDAEINGWEVGLSIVLGCLMMLPMLLDLFQPLPFPYGWLYLLPVCLYSVASTSHERNWTVLATSSGMLMLETLFFLKLHESANLWAVTTIQAATLVLACSASLFTHYRLWTLGDQRLQACLQQTQAELDRNRELLAMSEDAYHLSGYRFDCDTATLQLTDSFLELLGRTPESSTTLKEFELALLPGYQEQFAEAIRSCANQGIPFTQEIQLLSNRQERVSLQISGHPEYGGERITGITGLLKNLASEKALQKQYSREVARLHEIFKNMPGLLWELGSDGPTVINNSYHGREDTPDFDTLHRAPLSLIHPDDRFMVLRSWHAAQQSSHARFNVCFRIQCQDQLYRRFQVEAFRNNAQCSSTPLLNGEWVGLALPLPGADKESTVPSTDTITDQHKLAHKLNNVLTRIMGAAETIEMKPQDTSAVLAESRSILAEIDRASGFLREDDTEAKDHRPQQSVHALPQSGLSREQSSRTEPTPETVILLVDDDELVSRLTRDILTRGGYEVIVANDGMQALEILHGDSARIDILITDMFMPGKIFGSELAERTQYLYPHIHTLLMSGYDKTVVNFFKNSEGNKQDILTKPFKSEELLDRVKAISDKRRQYGNSVSSPSPQSLSRPEIANM